MSPPAYADLGKSARDLFSKGYNFGFIKVDTTTKSGAADNPLEFKSSASHNVTGGKLFGSADIKYKFPKYGITFTEKWNTDNVLGTEIVVQDQGVKGLKCTFDSSYAPQLGKRTGKIKADMTVDRVHINGDVNLAASPVVNGAVVTEYNGILLGLQGGFDAQASKLTHTHIALGYKTNEYALHTFINDQTEFGGSLYHKVNPKLEVATNVGWSASDSTTRFGVAGKYQLEQGTVVHGKVSNNSQIGVGLVHNLSDHLKLTLSALVSVQNFQEGGHKYGFGIEYCH